MTWTLVLTLFFTNQPPKEIKIPNWSTEKHCYVAGELLQEEHQKDKSVIWATIQCEKGGSV